MGKKGKSGISKGQFGLTSEDTQELRLIMRKAAETHGEQIVIGKLGFDSLTKACEAVHKDMTRADFGNMRNKVLELDAPRVKVNKYKDKADARRLALG